MKTLTFLALCLASTSAFAGTVTIPTTAKVMFQAAGGMEALMVLSPEGARAQVIDSTMKDIEEKQDENDLEYSCRGVYRQWSRVNVQELSAYQGRPTYMASVSVSVYCDPRDFSEKVAISAERACEREPKPECMSAQYTALFAKIKQTAYYDVNKPQN